jgi:hypothetical protein
MLDHAERLAEQAGVPTIQEYCAELLAHALEVERVKHHLNDVESRHGPLEGFKEIADDPNYLAEWQRQHVPKEPPPPMIGEAEADEELRPALPDLTVPVKDGRADRLPEPPETIEEEEDRDETANEHDPTQPDDPPEPPRVRIEIARQGPVPTVSTGLRPEVLDRSAFDTLLVHVGLVENRPGAFLPSLRRGQPVAGDQVVELLTCLQRIEDDSRGASMLDRRLAYALHRLAFESQVLLTEAWPGVFDETIIGAIRTVQERVERVLSGRDIRYYPSAPARSAEESS